MLPSALPLRKNNRAAAVGRGVQRRLDPLGTTRATNVMSRWKAWRDFGPDLRLILCSGGAPCADAPHSIIRAADPGQRAVSRRYRAPVARAEVPVGPGVQSSGSVPEAGASVPGIRRVATAVRNLDACRGVGSTVPGNGFNLIGGPISMLDSRNCPAVPGASVSMRFTHVCGSGNSFAGLAIIADPAPAGIGRGTIASRPGVAPPRHALPPDRPGM